MSRAEARERQERRLFVLGWHSLAVALLARCMELRADGQEALAGELERLLEEVENG